MDILSGMKVNKLVKDLSEKKSYDDTHVQLVIDLYRNYYYKSCYKDYSGAEREHLDHNKPVQLDAVWVAGYIVSNDLDLDSWNVVYLSRAQQRAHRRSRHARVEGFKDWMARLERTRFVVKQIMRELIENKTLRTVSRFTSLEEGTYCELNDGKRSEVACRL